MSAFTYRPIPLLMQYLTGSDNVTATMVIFSFFAVASIIFILFPFHEYAHALAAKLLGDDTAEREGRLTLNPIVHIDPMGAFFMLLAPFGWAKPVPVDPRNANRKITMRGFMSLTAAAGPVSNILLSLVFVIIAKIMGRLSGDSEMLIQFAGALWLVADISIFLAVFNLIPIPPLDGSKILMFFIPNRASYWLEKNANILRIVVLVSILAPFPFNILRVIINFISGFIMLAIDFATFFLDIGTGVF